MLHSFGGLTTNSNGQTGNDGAQPMDGVVFDSAGNMYGTCSCAGEYSTGYTLHQGMVWEITASGVYKDLHDFGGTIVNADGSPGPDGQVPGCMVAIDAAGNLYGTAGIAGPYTSTISDTWEEPGGGMVWEITASGVYKDLHDFVGATHQIIIPPNGYDTTTPSGGAGPVAGLTVTPAGAIYGTCFSGGPNAGLGNAGGGVWEITSARQFITLHDFGANAQGFTDGTNPWGGVTSDASGNLYGTTEGGGRYGGGTVWKITPGGAYSVIHDFGGSIINANGTAGPDGKSPRAKIAVDSSGNLWGTAFQGGPGASYSANGGMIWKISSVGAYTDIHDFDVDGPGWTLGDAPNGVTLDANGNLFGTTAGGGNIGDGIIYELSSSGQFTKLHDFTESYTPGQEGHEPLGLVTIDGHGALIGDCELGSPNGGGSVWRLPLNAPSAPTNLRGSGGVQMVQFVWDSVPGATSYNVYRSSTTSGAEVLTYQNITQTNWRNITQVPGKTLYFQVTAVNAAGESPRSNEVALVPLPLPAPTTVQATAGNGQVTVNWSQVTSLGINTTYSVFRGTTAGGEGATAIASGITGLSFTDTGRTNGTTYYYKVQAVNSISSSVLSSEASATPVSNIPLPPTGLAGSGGVQMVQFGWNASSGATSYNVYRSDTTSGAEVLTYTNITQLNWRNITQVPGKTLYFQVTAVNAYGESGRSNEVALVPLPLPAPANLAVAPGSKQVTLSWGTVTSLGITTTYNVYRGTTAGGESTTPIVTGLSSPSYTDTGLTGGTKYYYYVIATNSISSSVPSNEVGVTVGP